MTCLCDRFNGKYDGTIMNEMPEHENNFVDFKSRLQHHGVLWKRSYAQNKSSGRWMKRLFMVRDGWMFYYPETEIKDFPRRHYFNINPKGAIPLSECTIQKEPPGAVSAFVIASDELEGRLTLAAENDYERDKWISVLEKSKRITWANQQLSDGLIRQLEEHGMNMAKQKQDYFDALQSEVLELADEKEKTWELEKVNEELEKEKERMESFANEMKTDYDKVKSELEEMQTYMKALDTERSELRQQMTKQESDLEALGNEKESIIATLKCQTTVTEQLTQEKRQAEEEVRNKLSQIEERTEILLQEKAEAEIRLQENKERAEELEEEKTLYNEQAQELQSTIKDLTSQKEMTETELKEEIMARMEAEKRLKTAETSLRNLHDAVQNQTPNIEDDVKEKMVVNVNKLKYFFENLAEEAKLDPDKPVVLKNAIHARKTMIRRNKTRKFERKKSSSMRAKSLNMDHILMRGSKTMGPRRAQSTFVHTSSNSDEENREPFTIATFPPLQEDQSEHF